MIFAVRVINFLAPEAVCAFRDILCLGETLCPGWILIANKDSSPTCGVLRVEDGQPSLSNHKRFWTEFFTFWFINADVGYQIGSLLNKAHDPAKTYTAWSWLTLNRELK